MPIRISKTTKSKQINLIPQDEFESSNFGRILKWALSTFRVIVIITELVVMSAFLSRFWFDAKNSDLNEEIGILKSQVNAYKQIEAEFRSIQKRILITKSIYSELKVSSLIEYITRTVPQEVTLTNVSYNSGQIAIKALSLTEKSIAQFLVNLSDNKNLEEVTVSQLVSTNENDSIISFTVNAKVKNLANGGGK